MRRRSTHNDQNDAQVYAMSFPQTNIYANAKMEYLISDTWFID